MLERVLILLIELGADAIPNPLSTDLVLYAGESRRECFDCDFQLIDCGGEASDCLGPPHSLVGSEDCVGSFDREWGVGCFEIDEDHVVGRTRSHGGRVGERICVDSEHRCLGFHLGKRRLIHCRRPENLHLILHISLRSRRSAGLEQRRRAGVLDDERGSCAVLRRRGRHQRQRRTERRRNDNDDEEPVLPDGLEDRGLQWILELRHHRSCSSCPSGDQATWHCRT